MPMLMVIWPIHKGDNMKIDELYTKWLNGPEEIDATIANAPGNQTIKIVRNVHRAPLGDFLEAYIQHTKVPRWRRGWDWEIVNDIMKRALNTMVVQYIGDRA